MRLQHTRETLVRDLRALGVEPGDTLFIHSSFKSLGVVEGDAGTVVAALEEAVGHEGLILMPSFNLLASGDKRAEAWDIEKTPSTVGWLTEYFRCMPGTVRSDHYSHSVAARGKRALHYVSDHLCNEGLVSPWDREPWGRTFGEHSPMHRAYAANGKLFMLGVDYDTSTYIHIVEVLYLNERRMADDQAAFISFDRLALGEFWEGVGDLMRGKVGDAFCRLFSLRGYVDALFAEIHRDSSPYLAR